MDAPSWTDPDPSACTSQFIDSVMATWDKFSKPGLATYNHWWNDECRAAKHQYKASPSAHTRGHFLQQCKLAKKEYFAHKIEEMVKSRKPWEATSWIKQCAMPKVPQIESNGRVVNSLDTLFHKMHEQFAQSMSTPAATYFIEQLPQHDSRSWPPFSGHELKDALLTC